MSTSVVQAVPQKLVEDVVAFIMNVSSSVFIVFVNKVLMGSKGYNFKFASTLCAFHFLTCALSISLFEAMGYVKKVKINLKDVLIFALVANLSIASLNVSLLVNSVGFYQIAKLAIVPFVATMEYFFYSKVPTAPVIGSMALVLLGVSIVTITNWGVQLNTMGLVVAATSVVSSGMQQILCGFYQRRHKVSSHELLSNTAPVQGWTLLILGPFIDKLITGAWIGNYSVSNPALFCLVLSCSIAVAVNISQFACLGRFSAITFQVLGHSKTVLVLTGGWLFMGDIVTGRQLLGVAITVAGMVLYGFFSARAAAAANADAKKNTPEISSAPRVPLVSRGSHQRTSSQSKLDA